MLKVSIQKPPSNEPSGSLVRLWCHNYAVETCSGLWVMTNQRRLGYWWGGGLKETCSDWGRTEVLQQWTVWKKVVCFLKVKGCKLFLEWKYDPMINDLKQHLLCCNAHEAKIRFASTWHKLTPTGTSSLFTHCEPLITFSHKCEGQREARRATGSLRGQETSCYKRESEPKKKKNHTEE